MNIPETILTALITLGGAVLVAWITSRVTARRNSADVKLARIVQLEGRVDRLEARERVHQDYIEQLRQDIIDGRPPPPRPYPVYPD